MATITIDSGVKLSETCRMIIDIARHVPGDFTIRVTSGVRNLGNKSHHEKGLAVDLAVGRGGGTTNSLRMREVARFFHAYPGSLLELIHSTPFNDDNGFYVKNGKVVKRSFFGETIAKDHLDHVHVAMTTANARSLLASLGGTPPSTSHPPYPGYEMRKDPGKFDANVKVFQGRMRERGWDIGVDGYFGDQTDRVVRAFQKEKGLGVDGVVGPRTWAAAWTAPVT